MPDWEGMATFVREAQGLVASIIVAGSMIGGLVGYDTCAVTGRRPIGLVEREAGVYETPAWLGEATPQELEEHSASRPAP